MNPYKEFQFSWLIFFCMVPAEILMIYLFVFQIGDHPMDTVIFLFISALILLSYACFYGMTTLVADQWIQISFGIGLIRKNIKIETIEAIDTVTNPWYYGWGIRFIPHGMLFNIGGWEAVELKFKGEKRIIRIGSKDPMKLRNEIESRRHP
jgi:hypothetical protein